MSYLGTVDMNDADIKHYSLTSSTLTVIPIGWVPDSEQSLRVTINGVVQQGDTFSYSGSNLTLGGPLVVTDTLEVVGIQSVGNMITPADNSVTTTKLADDAVTTAKILDDNVTLAKMADGTQGDTLYYGAAGAPTLLAKPGTPAGEVLTFATSATAPSWVAAGGGLSDFSQWRLTTSFISYQNPITTNLELVDTYGGGGYGSVMTESSGEFTFPSTGWWYIGFGCDWITTGSETGCTGYITTTPDDSTWSNAAWRDEGVGSGGTQGSNYVDFIFQVASTTLSKVRFGVFIAGAVAVREAVTTIGSTSENRTSMTFIKLGDL